MNAEAISQSIRQWVTATMADVGPLDPQHVHLTEVGAHVDDGSPTEFRALSVLALRLAIETLAEKAIDVKALLVVALPPTDALAISPPSSWDEAFGAFSDEVPSLYLVARKTDMMWEECEEYRCPFPPLSADLGDTVSFYRSFRTSEAARDGWPFERCLYCAHIPSL